MAPPVRVGGAAVHENKAGPIPLTPAENIDRGTIDRHPVGLWDCCKCGREPGGYGIHVVSLPWRGRDHGHQGSVIELRGMVHGDRSMWSTEK